ncbi:glycine-rich protein, putative [Trichomonas vaginalis G3]|uniref:receptor protein-tyrosine kinase n=1 Tax=Trichomonas vaginalis (strain ATCC PRA-98 / G3) TaxID=412133 RepID=A2EBV7_TRIV3|nr:glycine-rich protein family [Trichomonas vaginalis G3]EAY09825.1 glycine-rich protein, putative [Trichomonas vaginalis G3]KAI5505950.1 glycine-rich protein family [Trichomonas vaginalis G3]|eukprot:XP_001322048.1 glycine-rich protein [Trichomonas vaginalis G3]
MISYELVNKTGVSANVNVLQSGNQYIFDYPCKSTSECTDYFVHLPRGTYKFELFGSSGGSSKGHVSSYRYSQTNCISPLLVKLYGGNVDCYLNNSIGGAGGYLSAQISLQSPVQAFFTLVGRGIFGHKTDNPCSPSSFEKGNMQPGGYGGGGSSSDHPYGTGCGGGQTAVKFQYNDLWHRVLVSGAGGGCDDNTDDDGSGGSGGNLTAQSWFYNGELTNSYYANSTFGFSFGQGEAARYDDANNSISVKVSQRVDIGGAGGGWFGVFSSQSGQGGAGGGSSWALTKDAVIPKGNIDSYNEFYYKLDSKPYAFDLNSEYLFDHVIHVPGIWEGNGKIILTIISNNLIQSCICKINIINSLTLYFQIFIL